MHMHRLNDNKGHRQIKKPTIEKFCYRAILMHASFPFSEKQHMAFKQVFLVFDRF